MRMINVVIFLPVVVNLIGAEESNCTYEVKCRFNDPRMTFCVPRYHFPEPISRSCTPESVPPNPKGTCDRSQCEKACDDFWPWDDPPVCSPDVEPTKVVQWKRRGRKPKVAPLNKNAYKHCPPFKEVQCDDPSLQTPSTIEATVRTNVTGPTGSAESTVTAETPITVTATSTITGADGSDTVSASSGATGASTTDQSPSSSDSSSGTSPSTSMSTESTSTSTDSTSTTSLNASATTGDNDQLKGNDKSDSGKTGSGLSEWLIALIVIVVVIAIILIIVGAVVVTRRREKKAKEAKVWQTKSSIKKPVTEKPASVPPPLPASPMEKPPSVKAPKEVDGSEKKQPSSASGAPKTPKTSSGPAKSPSIRSGFAVEYGSSDSVPKVEAQMGVSLDDDGKMTPKSSGPKRRVG